jgi:hypothetical protein
MSEQDLDDIIADAPANLKVVKPVRPICEDVVDQGSYPGEISKDHLLWLKERAAAHRRRWAEHARTLADKRES